MLRRTTKFYVVKFVNKGGLVMPIPLRIHYADNTQDHVVLPPEIWRYNSKDVKKMFLSEKEIVRFEIDPKREIADTDKSNNHWPPKIEPTRFELFKSKDDSNPMRKAADAAKKGEDQAKKGDDDKKPDDADEPANEADAKAAIVDQDGESEMIPAESNKEKTADTEPASPKKKGKEADKKKDKATKIKPDQKKPTKPRSDRDDVQ